MAAPFKTGHCNKVYINNIITNNKCTVKHVLGDPPREHWNRVTQDRRSLNTGLINIKCTVKGNYN
jgi:hypothetical protein